MMSNDGIIALDTNEIEDVSGGCLIWIFCDERPPWIDIDPPELGAIL